MKKYILLFLLFGLHSVFAQQIQKIPVPPVAVNDFAKMLEPFQQQALEQKLRDYNDSTSSAIVIITVPELDGYDENDVALKYLRDWKVGTKENDNGVVILLAKAERRVSIQTGYGMEGVLPDILAKDIIDERMIPFFKKNDYYGGLNNAIDAIIQAAAGTYKADPKRQSQNEGPSMAKILILIVVFIVLMKMMSGGGGGGGGSYKSRKGSRDFDGLPWFLLGNMLGGSGRGGGGFGGGGFGGGGFGGGGFGGFGGGGGGGGGASGGW